MLSLFLLDMGIAARRAKDLSASGAFLPLFAIVVPLVNAEQIVETIRPILKRYGGIALVSDCLWVTH